MLLYDRNTIGPSSEIFGYPRKSLAIFGKSSERFVKPLEQFWKMCGNLRKVVGNLSFSGVLLVRNQPLTFVDLLPLVEKTENLDFLRCSLGF